jgi:hypothetical protein
VSDVACAQCGQEKDDSDFIGRRGLPVQRCSACRELYKPGNYGIRGSVPRRGLRLFAEAPKVTWVSQSGNKKLGPIPAAIVSPETCPPSCGFYGKGCFPESYPSMLHWRNVERDGLEWEDFLARVRALPEGQLWRYAVSGDLPGNGEEVDAWRLFDLSIANAARRGFTFTHKPLNFKNVLSMQEAHRAGFTINLSADTLEEADGKSGFGLPVVVVVPSDAPDGLRTPAGRRLVMCPAETRGLTCAECQLCSVPTRKGIVAFRAHGNMKKTVSRIARGEHI